MRIIIPNPKSKILKGLFAFVGIIGSLYSLFHFGIWKEWHFPPWKLFSLLLLLILIEMIIRAERLARAVKIVGRKISFGQAFLANASGDVWGALTPSSIGGEVARLAAMTGSGLSAGQGIKALAVERLSLLLSLFCLVLGLGIYFFLKEPAYLELGPRWTSFLFYGGVVFILLALLVGFAHTTQKNWRAYLWKGDLFLLSLFHHAVRLGLLPAIIFYYQKEIPSPLIYAWSLVLGYGLSFVPIPSGGGTVEVAFMSALSPVLGEGMAAESLLVWRFFGHYFYVLSGAALSLWGSPLWGLPLWGSKRFFSSSQPLIKIGESRHEK